MSSRIPITEPFCAREISVTPLQVDRTHYPSLNHISRWLPALQVAKK